MDGLAAGAFDEIVFGAHDDKSASAGVEPPGDFYHVRSGDILSVGQGFTFEKSDEGFVAIGLPVS